MNDTHVLKLVNEVSSYLSLLSQHVIDLDGVTDEATLNSHYEEIDSLIETQEELVRSLDMYKEMVEAEIKYYQESYDDLVARRREQGTEAVENDSYTASILENYRKIPELEEVIKTLNGYDTLTKETRSKWNSNKNVDTVREIVETTTKAFDTMNASRERYGHVAVEIKNEGDVRKIKVSTAGKKVAVNVPSAQFNGRAVNKVVEGAILTADAKNDPIVSINLPNGEVISGRQSEIGRLIYEKIKDMPVEAFIKEEPETPVKEEAAPEVPVQQGEPVVAEEPVAEPVAEAVGEQPVTVEAKEPVIPETVEPNTEKPVEVPPVDGKEGDGEIIDEYPYQPPIHVPPMVSDETGMGDQIPSEEPPVQEEIPSEPAPEPEYADITDVHVLVDELRKLNPGVEIEPEFEFNRVFSSVPGDQLVLPKGFEYNDKNGLTNKHHTRTGAYVTLRVDDIALKRAAEQQAQQNRAADVGGDNVPTLDPEDGALDNGGQQPQQQQPVPTPQTRVNMPEDEEEKKGLLKVVKSKVAKLGKKKLYLGGLAALGLVVLGPYTMITALLGYGIFCGARKGVRALKKDGFHPIKGFKQWATTRSIEKVVREYEDLEFIVDENGPRIEDRSGHVPTPEEEGNLNVELAGAVIDGDADWKDLRGIYERKGLEVPTQSKDGILHRIADRFRSFFDSKEYEGDPDYVDRENAIPAEGTVSEPIVEEPVQAQPVTPEAPVAAQPVQQPQQSVPTPQVGNYTPREPKKKGLGGLFGMFGFGKKNQQAQEQPVAQPVTEAPVTLEPDNGIPTASEDDIEPVNMEPARTQAPAPGPAPVVMGARGYTDDELLQILSVLNAATDFDLARASIAKLLKGGFTAADLDFLYSNTNDDVKLQDLQAFLNANGYLADVPEPSMERGGYVR